MTKEQLIAMGLTEEQATEVMKSLDGNFVTKSRFDEVNEANKQLKKDVSERDAQLETLKTSTGDVDELKKQIDELQEKNKTDKANYEAQMKQMKLDSAVERSLTTAKAKNLTAVKALLTGFLEKAELDGDTVKGLDDEVKKLVEGEDTKFLFDVGTKSNKPTFKGVRPGEQTTTLPGEGQPATLADAVRLHFESE